MHMIAPISDGTLSVVPVTNSIHKIPAIAPGSAVRMMNGSSHDWKFTAISRYTSTTAKTMPSPRRKNDDLHGLDLAAQLERRAARQVGSLPRA